MSRCLVVLMGLPGSVKTTLASWLRQRVEVAIVSRDAIRAAMFPRCEYTVEEKEAAYDAMKVALTLALRQGKLVCTDGISFASQQHRSDMAQIAEELDVRVLWVWCDVPVEVAQERVANDTVTVFGDRDPDLVTEVADRFAPVPDGALRLDMTKSVDELGRLLQKALAS